MNARSLIDSMTTGNADGAARRAAIAMRAVDSLAALAAGRDTGEGRAIAQVFSGDDAAASVAAMAAIIRYSECDDIHVPSCMTAGCIVVPTALKFAVDASSFADAVEAGYAVGLALAQAVGGVNALAHGVWPALFAAPAVAAVTAAVAMGFDADKTAKALALSMSGASGQAGRPGGWPSGRWIVFGEAVRKGVGAALAVQLGAAGDVALLSEEWLGRHAPAGLAAPRHLESLPVDAAAAFTMKPYVSARQGANAIQAFCAILQRGVSPDAIGAIEVLLPAETLAVVTRPLNAADRLSTIANLGLQFGIAAYERDRLLDVARDRPFDPRSQAYAEKVTIVGDKTLTADEAATWPARVRAQTSNGVIEERCDILSGDPRDLNQIIMLRDKLGRLPGAAGLADHLNWEESGWKTFFQSLRRAHAGLGVRLGTNGNRAKSSEIAYN